MEGVHQSSQALSAAPSLLVSEAAIMNLYLSSMVNAVDPFTESLDTQVLASFSAAAASLSFLLPTYKLTAATTKLYQNMKDLFISGKISKNS